MSSNSVKYSRPGSHWWLVLVQGIAAIILGAFLLFRPGVTIATLIFFLGLYWLISGVITLVSLLWNREQWGLKLITGTVGIIAGLFIVRNPIISAFVVPAAYAFFLGILGIVLGIGQLIQAFRGGGWGIGVLGVMSIILGFLLITNPVIAGLSLAFLLGILLIVGGIIALFAAFRLRGEHKAYEEAQANASRTASAGSQTIAGAGSRAAGAVNVAGATATGAVGAAAVTGAAAVSRAGDNIAQTAGAAAATGGNIAQTVDGAVSTGATAASRIGDGIAQDAGDALGQAEDLAGDAAYAVRGAAGDVANGTTGLVAEGAGVTLDAAQDAGATIAEAAEAVFTGNVNPLDSEEMSKFKYPLEFIESVGQASANKLRAIGINNCLELLKQGYFARGRADIAEKSGIAGKRILTWVNHVDLYRIKGVGSEYADLLEASGVDTVVELAQRNPANLFTRMNEVNVEKKLVRKLPTQSQVQDWVAQAKGLPRIITY